MIEIKKFNFSIINYVKCIKKIKLLAALTIAFTFFNTIYCQDKIRVQFVNSSKFPTNGKTLNSYGYISNGLKQVSVNEFAKNVKNIAIKNYNKSKVFIIDTVNSPKYYLHIDSLTEIYEENDIPEIEDDDYTYGSISYSIVTRLYDSNYNLVHTLYTKGVEIEDYHVKNDGSSFWKSPKIRLEGVGSYENKVARTLMKKTSIYLKSSRHSLLKRKKELITLLGLCLDFGMGIKFKTTEDTNTTASVDLGVSHVIKRFNFGYFQMGVGASYKMTNLFNIPINNEIQDLSFSPVFLNLKNNLYVSLYQNIPSEKAYYIYVAYNFGYGIKSFRERAGEYFLNDGLLNEVGIGVQLCLQDIYINIGALYSNFSYEGKIISSDSNLSDINLNLTSNSLSFQFGIGYSFGY
jgi:hypothetical protein